jgi:transposase-like protein
VFGDEGELRIATRVLVGGEPQSRLARELGVHRNTIANIVRRRSQELRATTSEVCTIGTASAGGTLVNGATSAGGTLVSSTTSACGATSGESAGG